MTSVLTGSASELDSEPQGAILRRVAPDATGSSTGITLRVPGPGFSMPRTDISALISIPKLDFSRLILIPKVDFSNLIPVPKIDFSPFVAGSASVKLTSAMSAASIVPTMNFQPLLTSWIPEIAKAHAFTESLFAPSAGILADRIMANWRETMAGINSALTQRIDWDALLRHPVTPNNWSDGVHERLPELVELVNVDGIPAAWVPRAEILEALLSADTGDARTAILIDRRSDILDDCAAVLEDLDDEFLADGISIAEEVLDSCRVGNWRVAALAAIPIVHSIVESLRWASDRQRAAHHHQLTMDLEYRHLTEMATRAPLVNFYDDWHPNSGKPRPVHLTRHVASHRLGADQVTARNCTVAIMLMTSLLVTVHRLDLGQRAIAA